MRPGNRRSAMRVRDGLGPAVIAGIVAFFVSSGLGSADAPQQPSSRDQTDVPSSGGVDTFAVFRRNRRSEDDVPSQFASWPVPAIREMDLANSRLAYRAEGTSFYLVPL